MMQSTFYLPHLPSTLQMRPFGTLYLSHHYLHRLLPPAFPGVSLRSLHRSVLDINGIPSAMPSVLFGKPYINIGSQILNFRLAALSSLSSFAYLRHLLPPPFLSGRLPHADPALPCLPFPAVPIPFQIHLQTKMNDNTLLLIYLNPFNQIYQH